MIRIVTTFFRNFQKFLPMLLVIVLVTVASVTDVFSPYIHVTLRQAFLDYFHKMLPFAIDLMFGALMVNIAWVFYKPFCTAFEAVLSKTHASDRGKDLSLKLFKFFYWSVVAVLVLSLTAAEFISRFIVGFGVFGAALTLSLQGAANDFICGLLIQFTRKITEKDEVKVEGLDVQGSVREVGMLSTTIESKADVIRVPNREIWARALKTKKPAKSPLLLPPDYQDPRS